MFEKHSEACKSESGQFPNVLTVYVLYRYRLNTITPLIMRPEDETTFKQDTVCSICLEQFDQKETKVMDHDHISGAFRGAAHPIVI